MKNSFILGIIIGILFRPYLDILLSIFKNAWKNYKDPNWSKENCCSERILCRRKNIMPNGTTSNESTPIKTRTTCSHKGYTPTGDVKSEPPKESGTGNI